MSMRILAKAGLLHVGALVVVPAPAQALELSGGVGAAGGDWFGVPAARSAPLAARWIGSRNWQPLDTEVQSTP